MAPGTIWDLPGCDTPNNPSSTYTALLAQRPFTRAIITGATRLTETDVGLVKYFASRGIPWWYVRTKIDVVDNTEDEASDVAVVERLRAESFQALRTHVSGGEAEHVLVVSSRRWELGDLAILCTFCGIVRKEAPRSSCNQQ
eukprot:TRINITY_DN164_c0_g2_i4.p2 TRINITY_DN164_c0_g2~~TRINITY_DN164_c0_g2_i4.p2  ORF type:complete len:142 (-),score=22.00 TRINITY_DN164_c0_g2_i4:444-869(-)